MGKTSLIAIGLALTLSSLIPVDSTDQIAAHRYLTKIGFNVNYCNTGCDPIIQKLDDLSLNPQFIRSIVSLIGNSFVFLYCCLAIGSLCDRHFVPNLTALGDSLSLSPEITSSILIPFGTSGPEIFSSIIGILFADNEIGTGAIIGSSCYNQLAIPAACGLTVAYFIGKPIKLDAEPILKDLLFYIISIIGLIFTIKDNSVDIFDSILLLLLFALYIGVKIGQNSGVSEQIDNNNNESELIGQEISADKNHSEEEEESEDFMTNKYLKTLLLPLSVMFELTMPSKMSSLIKFFISIVWLSTLSYFSVNAITDLSETLRIPHTIAGMTILAAGSAVPDLVTSVIVIRKSGKASMGICSAISANIFAILVGLGLPWFIKCAINGYNTSIPSFVLYSKSLPFTSSLLLVAIFALIIALKMTKWQLFNKLAYLCGSIHATFFVLTLIVEYLV